MKILITGGNSGIGAEIAYQLQEYTTYAPPHQLMDTTDPGEAQRYVREFAREISVLINCAGINYLEHIGKLDMNETIRVIDTNVIGYINMIDTCVRCCPGLNRIINIGSIASRIPMRCSLVYNASKAAVDMITKQAARELAPAISVFGVNPGKTYPSKMSEYVDKRVPEIRGWSFDYAKKYQIDAIPMKRSGTTGDVAEVVKWIVEEAPEYMTGSIIEIAGGM